MTAKRVNIILMAVLAISLVGLAAGTYGISGLITNKSQELARSKGRLDKLNAQQTGLVTSKRDIARYADLEKITKTIVPQDKDQAQAVREITRIASSNKIALTTITFPSSTLGTAPVAAAGSAPVAAAATTAVPNLSQLTRVANIPGVYNLQITVGNNANNTVSFNQLDAFLRALETNRRTAAVSSISIQPQPENPSRFVFTLVINTYIKPS